MPWSGPGSGCFENPRGSFCLRQTRSGRVPTGCSGPCPLPSERDPSVTARERVHARGCARVPCYAAWSLAFTPSRHLRFLTKETTGRHSRLLVSSTGEGPHRPRRWSQGSGRGSNHRICSWRPAPFCGLHVGQPDSLPPRGPITGTRAGAAWGRGRGRVSSPANLV